LVDRVYKTDLVKLKNALEKLRDGFYGIDTDIGWVRLRIEILLKHIEYLEQLLHSPEFSLETKRLRRGVGMFHSDLVYLRENVKELEKFLQAERKNKDTGPRVRKHSSLNGAGERLHTMV